MSFPICPACQKETKVFAELDPRFGVTRKCGNTGCGAIMPDEPAPARSSAATPAMALAVVQSTATGASGQTPPFAPRAAAPSPQPAQSVTDPLRPLGDQSVSAIVATMRERLAAVEALLAVKSALEEERDQLRRMLAAIDPTPTKALN